MKLLMNCVDLLDQIGRCIGVLSIVSQGSTRVTLNTIGIFTDREIRVIKGQLRLGGSYQLPWLIFHRGTSVELLVWIGLPAGIKTVTVSWLLL